MKRLAETVIYGALVILAVGALALFATLPDLSLVTAPVYQGF